MASLFQLLDKIQVKPGMYIGGTSVTDLFMFLGGYKTARHELGIPLTEPEKRFYREFQPWLQRRFGITTSRSWAKILEFHCINQKEAFESFFKLLDEFCASEALDKDEQPLTMNTIANELDDAKAS